MPAFYSQQVVPLFTTPPDAKPPPLMQALRGEPGRSVRPVFVSSGHRISLTTAVAVTKACSVHRTPEPIRQADLRSRTRIRQAEASRAD